MRRGIEYPRTDARSIAVRSMRRAAWVAGLMAAALAAYVLTPLAQAAGSPAVRIKLGVPVVFKGTPAVGALFSESDGKLVRHFCTASVVASPAKNLLITAAGEVKVTDFGLARATSPGKAITAPGSAIGTPMYMAPELVSAKEATARADVYALGTILYEALTGTPPHVGRNVMEIYRKTMLEKAVPPGMKNPKVDAGLDAIVMKTLEKAPEARYAEAGALADALGRYLGKD